MRRCDPATDSIRDLLIRLLAELQPELLARRVQLELDLDEVTLAGPAAARGAASPPAAVVQAIRGLLADAIESTGYDGELAVTLIDADTQWELELATIRSVDHSARQQPARPAGSRAEPDAAGARQPQRFARADATAPAIPLPGPNFDLSSRAATSCGGQVGLMRCPQGGMARLLVMPKPRRLDRAA